MALHELVQNRRACVVDCKGMRVFVGDTVVDSYAREHKVVGFEPIDPYTAWIVDEWDMRLVPHIVEKTVDRKGVSEWCRRKQELATRSS